MGTVFGVAVLSFFGLSGLISYFITAFSPEILEIFDPHDLGGKSGTHEIFSVRFDSERVFSLQGR